jgi:site-specific recombinase XerD
MDDSGIKPAGKGRWHVRVKRIEARTGKTRNRKATVTGTKADAVRVRDELRAEIASTALRPRRIRLSEFAASWLERRVGSLKPGTIRRYVFALRHVLPVLGEIYVDSLTSADVAGYIAGRVADVGVKGGHSVLNELRMLRTMSADAVAEGLCARDWCDRVKAPKVRTYTRERPNLLTAPQFNALMARVAPQWLGLLLLMVTTGLRMGEASALHWEDVDFAAGEALIRWSNDRGRLVEVKTAKSNRIVPVLPDVAALWGPRGTGLVFPSRRGGLHRGSPLRKVLDKACMRAHVPRVTAHGLRRTFNNLARQQTSKVVLQSITGHTTDEMTAHYSMVSTDEKAVASQAVAKLIGVGQVRPTETN